MAQSKVWLSRGLACRDPRMLEGGDSFDPGWIPSPASRVRGQRRSFPLHCCMQVIFSGWMRDVSVQAPGTTPCRSDPVN